MASKPKLTPMMAQYRQIRNQLPADALLLFRLGDFYEMFFEDARIGSRILNVALTKRGTTPMCGIPYHATPGYVGRLLKAGRKVALCDQVEEAKPGQLVKREVTQILSPGTHFDERMLSDGQNNFLAALCRRGNRFGLAFVDLTTGDFKATEVDGEDALQTEMVRLRPAEIIFPAAATELRHLVADNGAILNEYEDWVFDWETAFYTVKDHFKVASLDGYGLKDREAAVGAAGGVLHYLTQHLRRDVAHLTRISCYRSGDFLALDAISLRNLEILEPLSREAPRQACLLGAWNRTRTPMGTRKLRDWLTQPLANREAIRARQDVVQAWLDSGSLLEAMRGQLEEIRDLERTLGRLSTGSGNARDLQALRTALDQVPGVRETLHALGAFTLREQPVEDLGLDPATPPPDCPGLITELIQNLTPLPELADLIRQAIVEEPPPGLREGGLIRDGFDAALDELRSASRDGKSWIARLQKQESERTGIPSLKIRYNSVFGYFIEVTRTHLEKVPEDYVRKQTVSNGERYITPELKEVEAKILGAEERSSKLEYDLFLRVREAMLGHLASLQDTAETLARIDVLASFAETARHQDCCRPEIGEDGTVDIQDGRHPVLDQALAEERFVPNDTRLDAEEQQIMLITGPNMAGKSTFIRQVALLTLLAHTGSFIPARRARVDLVDRIFTRIGASDDLSRGQSTFMVEMSETANILHHATPQSLVILDEIGRGTSTFDGLSLAWSIVEHLHHRVGAKTLFATHYHELAELAGRLKRVRNFNVLVREYNDRIIFLRKIAPGNTDKSYGIQVARLAGVPAAVLERAREILGNLEESELTPEGRPRRSRNARPEREKLRELPEAPQLDLFGVG